MEKKLIEFVMNHFDDDERTTNEEAIKEINGNLIDRYHDLLSQGKSEEESYLECINTLGDIRNQLTINKKVDTSKISIKMQFLIFFLSGISIVSFFFYSGIGLTLLLVSIVLFSYLYLFLFRQAKQALTHDNIGSSGEELLCLTKSLFPLMIMWVISVSLLIFETLLILFSNLDKLVIQMFYQSTPIGIFFLMWLVFSVFIFFSVLPNYATIIKRYQLVTGNTTTLFPLQKIVDKMKNKKSKVYSVYKKQIYLKYFFFSLLHIVLTMLSETRQYYRGFVLLPSGDQGIRTILTDSSPLWKRLLDNPNNIGFILLLIIIVVGIVMFTYAFKHKQLYLRKIFLIFNFSWFIGILITAFSFMFYTGIINDFSIVSYYSISVIAIQITFLILNRKTEELLYE